MKAAFNNRLDYNISLFELIFSIRNKDYGAYVLRSSYKKTLSIALFITAFVFIVVTTFPLFLKKNQGNTNTLRKPVSIPITLDNPTIQNDINKQQINTEILKAFKPTIKYIAPTVIPDEKIKVIEDFPTLDDLRDKNIGTRDLEGDSAGGYLVINDIEDTVPIVKPDKTEERFSWVEEMPSYPGGNEALISFMSKNIIYPEIAKRAGVEGKVLISYVVERDGSISEIKIIKGIGAGCDEEAVRVLKLAGKWMPGKQNGKAVRVNMVIPVVFTLD
jgi:protein TonB